MLREQQVALRLVLEGSLREEDGAGGRKRRLEEQSKEEHAGVSGKNRRSMELGEGAAWIETRCTSDVVLVEASFATKLSVLIQALISSL